MDENRSRPAKDQRQHKRISTRKTEPRPIGLPKFLDIAIAVTIAMSALVLGIVLHAYFTGNPGIFTAQFSLTFAVTFFTALLYLLRYYGNVTYYENSEKSLPELIVSICILATGAVLFVATLFQPLWVLLYGCLLLLSIAKKYQIIRNIDVSKNRQDSYADRAHEIDTITLEASIAAFVLMSFFLSRLYPQDILGLGSSNNLVAVNALLLLCYIAALLVNKLARYTPSITKRLKGE